MDFKGLKVNGQRLRATLEQMAGLGATPAGGVHRLALSDEDKTARDLFAQWLGELGVGITVDEMGNIFGLRPGRRPALEPVMIGSHLDTQPHGGRFDGVLGVLGGLEVLRTLNEYLLETARDLILVNWTNEEGSRFSPAMVGSGVWSGKLELAYAHGRQDGEGKSLGRELERIGYLGETPAARRPFAAYFEYHIEQGPILEREGFTIGAPEGIVGLTWGDVTIEGASNHTGTTPMDARQDALCAAAEMVLALNRLPDDLGLDMLATVGEIHNQPNSRNVIPGRAAFTIDMRAWNDQDAEAAWTEMQSRFEAIARKRGCALGCQKVWAVGRMPFEPRLVDMVETTARELGYPVKRMRSGAGHDAGYMSMIGPVAMIFVPSVDGRSHVEVENTSWADCEAGANVLLHCVLQSRLIARDRASRQPDQTACGAIIHAL